MDRSGVLLRYFVLALIAMLGADMIPAAPQEQPSLNAPLVFDVVSIEQARAPRRSVAPGEPIAGTQTSCRYLQAQISCQLSILNLIHEAYQVEYFQLDSPKWTADSDHIFAVTATMPAGTSAETARLMLRHALADRFDLKIHWERRIIPVYALIPGAHGVRLQPAEGAPQIRSIDTPTGKVSGFLVAGPGVYKASAVTLDFLALDMGHRADLDRPVVNMTGLTGKYNIELNWEPTVQSKGVVTQGDPGFLTAVRGQLGLQIEKRALPFEVLVVDHADSTPSPN